MSKKVGSFTIFHLNTGDSVFVNINQITYFAPQGEGTLLHFCADQSVYVTEKPPEVALALSGN